MKLPSKRLSLWALLVVVLAVCFTREYRLQANLVRQWLNYLRAAQIADEIACMHSELGAYAFRPGEVVPLTPSCGEEGRAAILFAAIGCDIDSSLCDAFGSPILVIGIDGNAAISGTEARAMGPRSQRLQVVLPGKGGQVDDFQRPEFSTDAADADTVLICESACEFSAHMVIPPVGLRHIGFNIAVRFADRFDRSGTSSATLRTLLAKQGVRRPYPRDAPLYPPD